MLVLLVLIPSGNAWADIRDPWWGRDKALHLTVGTGIGAGCYGTLWAASTDPAEARLLLCATLGWVPGIAKEIYDAGQPANHFSGKDLFWTSLGVLATTALLFGIEQWLAGSAGGEKSVPP